MHVALEWGIRCRQCFAREGLGRGVLVTVDQSNVDTQERADHGTKNWQGVLEAMKKLVEEQIP